MKCYANRLIIFLGEKATKWETVEHCVDGLTTNGVLIMSPNGMFCPGEQPQSSTTSDNKNNGVQRPSQMMAAKPGVWREISVRIYPLIIQSSLLLGVVVLCTVQALLLHTFFVLKANVRLFYSNLRLSKICEGSGEYL